MQSNATPQQILAALWELAKADPQALERCTLTGSELQLPSTFRVAAAAAACISAAALAAAEIWRLRTGRTQSVELAVRDAALAYRSERYLRLDGAPVEEARAAQSYFLDRNGRLIQLHMVYPHHRDGIQQLLECGDDDTQIAAAVAQLDAFALEEQLAERGLPGYALRSHEEWRGTAQAAALATLPPFAIERIGDTPPLEMPDGATRPLSGLRVLDLTRVIAGPVCGRTLAAHGADVLRIHPPHMGEVKALLLDGGRGKRCANLDLRERRDKAAFENLLNSAHVLVQGFRPGGLAELGYPPELLAERWPGLIYLSLSAWSDAGPWATRHGFDSLVQTATGIVAEGSQAAGVSAPRPLPCQALDHSTGYLAALAVLSALARRMRQGGTWHARLSLAQTGHWLDGLGRIDGLRVAEPAEAVVAERLREQKTSFGTMTYMMPAAELSETPPRWDRPPVPLGNDAPAW